MIRNKKVTRPPVQPSSNPQRRSHIPWEKSMTAPGQPGWYDEPEYADIWTHPIACAAHPEGFAANACEKVPGGRMGQYALTAG
jgi:hypothetical protein